MIVVMQCAGTKRTDAGCLKTRSGNKVHFVGRPQHAPPSSTHMYAHPDDTRDDGRTWRQHLVAYNEEGSNPDGLCQAFEFYVPPAAPDIYCRLVDGLGVGDVYILSAGWGLIRANYLTPSYDITFAPEARKAAPWKYRGKEDTYHDLCHLSPQTTDAIVFIGGKSYVALFCLLTKDVSGDRTVFYNSTMPPRAPGCNVQRFHTSQRMNWQYLCASQLLSNRYAP